MGTFLSRAQDTTTTTTVELQQRQQQETTTTCGGEDNGVHGHGPALRIPDWLFTAAAADHVLPQSTLESWSKADVKVRKSSKDYIHRVIIDPTVSCLGSCNCLSCIIPYPKGFLSCDQQHATRVDHGYPYTIHHVIVIIFFFK